jgi:hypothetical protein
LVLLVGSLDLGSVLASGDSVLFEELGIKEPITEASWGRPNDDAAVGHPESASGRYHAAIIEIRNNGGDTYRIALPVTSDEEFRERMSGVFGD